MLHDRVEIVELRRPAELRAQAPAVGDDRGRIACAAAGEPHGKVAPAHALDRLDHLQNRGAVPIAAVERLAFAAAAQMPQRRQMGAREIGDMDVIADAGAVGRVVVGAKNLHAGP